jgi:hypothetical protein
MNNLRLSTSNTSPLSPSSATAVGTVYLMPWSGQHIELYDSVTTTWISMQVTSPPSIVLSALTADRMYDIFAYYVAADLPTPATVAIEALIWTNVSTRATAISFQDGVVCKTGDKTRMYLGTMYVDAAKKVTCHVGVSGATITTRGTWGLFNYHNRVPVYLTALQATSSWAYTTATWRAWNTTQASFFCDIVLGVDDQVLDAEFWVNYVCSGGNAEFGLAKADSTGLYDISSISTDGEGNSTIYTGWGSKKFTPNTTWPGTVGQVRINPCERGDGSTACTVHSADPHRSGIIVRFAA